MFKIFWWKIEGLEVLNGLNMYKPSDPHSAGIIVRLWRVGFRVRYSKRTKKWHIGFCRFTPLPPL